MSRSLTNEHVNEFITSFGYRMLSDYISSSKYITLACPENHIYQVKYNNFKAGKRCPECAMVIRKNKLKLDINQVRQLFIDNNCIPLFDEYENANQPLKYQCQCGNISHMRLGGIKRGNHCSECKKRKTSEHFRRSYSYVQNFFKENGCTLLSDTYTNGKEKLHYICECGNEAYIAFSKFKIGQRCYQCKLRKISEKTKGVPRPKWSGENHPGWKPDRTDEERLADRKFPEYHEWRKSVLARDRYTCQCCGKVGGRLNAHHLDGWNWCIEKRLDEDNGVTLCSDCHKEFHLAYGKGDNTKEQFEEFSTKVLT